MREVKQYQRRAAVALGYNHGQEAAPKVLAKGKGHTAENIIQKAKENNLPIQEDPSLVEMLSQLELNQRIPEELYEAVAEVFTFIYKIEEKTAAGNSKE
ncbi:EscU/YscU/HrcU family type III secretion system export apparatus switch protein [Mesobacillus foraminis]|uniref:Flagellar biosynthesis protein n=1 Tax=Mesobacillus foraminis TaxID=279826 RepID=A0A4R2BFS6_9BACI|nr:EscU/YscU/HrcU family type III secretion system export apparatus switch protein [Mesobacillus foraminis]TCN25636.1 flagellar biosynthesis protein [Mesobacillus foraminis]